MSEQDEWSGNWNQPGHYQERQPEKDPMLFFLGTKLSMAA